MARFTRLSEHSRRAEQLQGGLRGTRIRGRDRNPPRARLPLPPDGGFRARADATARRPRPGSRPPGDPDPAEQPLPAHRGQGPGHGPVRARPCRPPGRGGDVEAVPHPGVHPPRGETAFTEASGALERAVELDPGLARGLEPPRVRARRFRGPGGLPGCLQPEPSRRIPGSPKAASTSGTSASSRATCPPPGATISGRWPRTPSYTRARLALGNLYVELDSLGAAAASYRLFLRDWRGDPEGADMARAALEKLGESP